MQKRAFLWSAILLLSASLIAGCGTGSTAQPTSAAPSSPTAVAATAVTTSGATTIRVGYVPVLVYSPLFVAQERGYFADEGLAVELVPTQGGSEPVVQLAAGNFEAAVGGAGAGLLNAAQQGVRFKIVAPMHSEKPPLATKLVISAKRASEFTSVADLRGKKVAINATGAATEYWLDQALEKNGLTINDIELTTVAFRDVSAALESGSLDAAMLGEPLVAIGVQNDTVAVLADNFIDGFTSTFLYMGDALLESNPAAAEGFMRAYLRACRDMQGEYMTPELAAIIEKYTQVPAAIIQEASLPQYSPDGIVPISDLETLQTYFLGRGLLQYSEPLDLAPFVDTTLAERAVAELGQ